MKQTTRNTQGAFLSRAHAVENGFFDPVEFDLIFVECSTC